MEKAENNIPISSNPIGSELAVEVSIPSKVEIKMIEASSFEDYDLWGKITSVCANFCVGFFVAALTNTVSERKLILWGVAIIFGCFTVYSLLKAKSIKKKMSTSTSTVKMKAAK